MSIAVGADSICPPSKRLSFIFPRCLHKFTNSCRERLFFRFCAQRSATNVIHRAFRADTICPCNICMLLHKCHTLHTTVPISGRERPAWRSESAYVCTTYRPKTVGADSICPKKYKYSFCLYKIRTTQYHGTFATGRRNDTQGVGVLSKRRAERHIGRSLRIYVTFVRTLIIISTKKHPAKARCFLKSN